MDTLKNLLRNRDAAARGAAAFRHNSDGRPIAGWRPLHPATGRDHTFTRRRS
jgi:hypothetical protein